MACETFQMFFLGNSSRWGATWHGRTLSSHVEPLIRVYRATTSAADRKLLSIFQIQRKTSITYLLSRWSPSPDLTSSTALEALQNLDPIRVLRTCLTFPKWRRKIFDKRRLACRLVQVFLPLTAELRLVYVDSAADLDISD
jgi:hypothetical protein